MWTILAVTACTIASICSATSESNQIHQHHHPDHHDHDHEHDHDHDHKHDHDHDHKHDHGQDRINSGKHKRFVDYVDYYPVADVDYYQAQPVYQPQHYQPPPPPPVYYQKPPCKHTPTYPPPTYRTTTPTYTRPPTYPPPTYKTTKRPHHLDRLTYLAETLKDAKDSAVHNVQHTLDHLMPKSESVEVPRYHDGCGCNEQFSRLGQAVLFLQEDLLNVRSYLTALEPSLLDGRTKVVKFVKESKMSQGEEEPM